MLSELVPKRINSMGPSLSFLKGLHRRISKKNKKVFFIGFHKCGTSSLAKAMQILGYDVCGSLKNGYGYRKIQDPKAYIWECMQSELKHYTVFQDTPWFLFYKQLFDTYPDAYFILNNREEDRWLQSYLKHFRHSSHWKYHDIIYDVQNGDIPEERLIEKFREHQKEVRNYFKNHSRFIEMNISKDFNWDVLCDFLDENRPIFNFPKANNRETINTDLYRLKKTIKRGLKKIYRN